MPEACAFDEGVAAHYEAWYGTEEGRRADALEKQSLQRLHDCVPGARGVLEVGCGTGHFTRWLEEQGLSAVGLDLSAAMLSEAKTRNRVPYVQADAHHLPFADNTFDLTAFATTLEFLEAPREALREAIRVAARGLLLGVLNRWSVLAVRRRLAGLFRPSVYDEARFYSVGVLRQLLREADAEARNDGDRESWQIIWHTTLFPRWIPWERAKLPWGGFIAMALLTPGPRQGG
jgi:ubiquinone/menaquinone biosynthesis C-methylase UbiE